jgi:hypothetical protein
LVGGSVFTNRNVFTASSGASFGAPFSNALGATFTQSAGTTTFNGAFSNNAGSVANIDAGTLAVPGGFTSSGVVSLNGGAISTGTLLLNSPGEMRGTGTITGSVNNFSGTVRPGGTGAAGTITITGTYTQGALGTLAAELGGTGAGQFDVLAVGGNATLDGALDIARLGGFTPSTGNSFRVVESANNPTTFTTLTGQTSGLTQAADATGLVLTQNALAFTWDNSAGNGDWFNPLNWDRDSGVPGAADTAILNIASTINLVSDTSVATFQQSNGTFSGAGTLTILNSGTFSAGALSGSGTTFIAAGATLAISGATDKQIDGRTLSVAGLVTLAGTGNLRTEFDGTVNILAGGLFDVQSDISFVAFGGNGSGFVNNAGIFQKSGGHRHDGDRRGSRRDLQQQRDRAHAHGRDSLFRQAAPAPQARLTSRQARLSTSVRATLSIRGPSSRALAQCAC